MVPWKRDFLACWVRRRTSRRLGELWESHCPDSVVLRVQNICDWLKKIYKSNRKKAKKNRLINGPRPLRFRWPHNMASPGVEQPTFVSKGDMTAYRFDNPTPTKQKLQKMTKSRFKKTTESQGLTTPKSENEKQNTLQRWHAVMLEGRCCRCWDRIYWRRCRYRCWFRCRHTWYFWRTCCPCYYSSYLRPAIEK